MKVIFFDGDDDEYSWDVEMSAPPREGERVILPVRKIRKVTRVTWCVDEREPYVEVVVGRIT